MILLGIDVETTGLDLVNDRITEVGYALWGTTEVAPAIVGNVWLYEPSMETRFTPEACEMMARVCGITPEMIRKYGRNPLTALEPVLDLMSFADVIVAHNGENFDKPMWVTELKRQGMIWPDRLPWIDTRSDIPWQTPPDSLKLKHLALDAGFINPFPHRATFDVVTMLKVLMQHDVEKVLEYSKLPWMTVRADVSYADREKAKAQRYSWERLGDLNYPKCWIKRIKTTQLEAEKAACPFPVLVL